MNHLYRNNVHQVKTNIFVPGGGKPRTLNETNYLSFLNETGKPTSKGIFEGANLYLTSGARKALEKLGVLIFKDSSCKPLHD
jgi:glutamate dehydrogenase